jgi:hypothetical protein
VSKDYKKWKLNILLIFRWVAAAEYAVFIAADTGTAVSTNDRLYPYNFNIQQAQKQNQSAT